MDYSHPGQNDTAAATLDRTTAEELRARAGRGQAAMREAQLDGLLVTQNADIFYLSGAVQQAQLYIPVEGEPLLMVRKHPGRAASSSKPPRAML